MANVAEQLDEIEKRVFSGLKDFQQATVNRIEQLYKAGQRRVLVSDEVGLGKTLIARGTVAKVARLRKEEGDTLFKVVYVCSNGAIADQNLQKLRITSEARAESVSSSRLSMQHLKICQQENDDELKDRYIHLIPLTPDTSFRMTSGTGVVGERALMFVFLRRIPELQDYISELETAMTDCAHKAWGWCRKAYEDAAAECNQKSGGKYFADMLSLLEREIKAPWKDGMTYLDSLISLCRTIRENQGKRVGNTGIIGQLRIIFAKISLDKLEPDLVIMDEFQRFRYLLDAEKKPDTETGMLAQKFFHSDKVRMLLLSATPYKMYSTMEERDETNTDEHYEEFLNVMDFLNMGQGRNRQFRTVWKDFSVKLKELTLGDTTILAAKKAAEDAMYQSVCRTERISEKGNADIIDDSDKRIPLQVMENDIRSYVEVQKLLDEIGLNEHVPVDYIKSTPYLMSFMKDYQLKRDIERYFINHRDETDKINNSLFWIKKNSLDRYDKIPNNNARLDHIMDYVMRQGAEKLLWVPPSKPYYELQGPFRQAERFTKTLIFSSWEMVPRMLASLISYEAERLTVGDPAIKRPDREVHYFYTDEKRYPPARMNFAVRDGRPSGMPLFCLIYPSGYLAGCYDPITCINAHARLRDIRKQIKTKISQSLKQFSFPESGRPDGRWYYLVPMLLDGTETVLGWISAVEADLNADNEDEKNTKSGYKAHLDLLRELLSGIRDGRITDLGKYPADLSDVLTDMAIASPAVCIRRTYEHYAAEGEAVPLLFPTQLARIFLNRMNTVESTAVVEMTCAGNQNTPHWKNMLTYCRYGNMQAVFDEYAHLISSGIDRDGNMAERIHEQMKDAMNIRTTTYRVDTYPSFQRRMKGQKDNQIGLRTHFAAAFTKGEEKESNTNRKKVLRNAFNSPFRPFVLATTSIGQEGLDFHHYCRRIVHWNLPANPIDLEQREGRINRFECLAIRQNIAKRYGSIPFKHDIWNEMFEAARDKEKKDGMSDLIPYWGLKKTKNMIRIERIVPMYPFSRDELAYERLIKILSMYRLTLGQARQEELLEYLFQNCDDPEKLRKLFINLSPYYKGKG
ncbi:MAG: helicase [Clostridiales bacterium]|nr:helicase [Clostridiales bacterium]